MLSDLKRLNQKRDSGWSSNAMKPWRSSSWSSDFYVSLFLFMPFSWGHHILTSYQCFTMQHCHAGLNQHDADFFRGGGEGRPGKMLPQNMMWHFSGLRSALRTQEHPVSRISLSKIKQAQKIQTVQRSSYIGQRSRYWGQAKQPAEPIKRR